MQIITFDETAVSKSKSMQDFYTRIGLWDQFVQEHTDIRQLWMNKEQNEDLSKALKRNAKKNKDCTGFNQKHLDKMASWDWFNYSPVSESTIPRNELWFLTAMKLNRLPRSLGNKRRTSDGSIPESN